MYRFIIIPFQKPVWYSHGIIGDEVLHTVTSRDIKGGEQHVSTFVVATISTVRKLAVLDQGVEGRLYSWHVEYVPFINDLAPQSH